MQMQLTPQIENELPNLVMHIALAGNKCEFIPPAVASASTIWFAIQQQVIVKTGECFKLTGKGA